MREEAPERVGGAKAADDFELTREVAQLVAERPVFRRAGRGSGREPKFSHGLAGLRRLTPAVLGFPQDLMNGEPLKVAVYAVEQFRVGLEVSPLVLQGLKLLVEVGRDGRSVFDTPV